MQRDQMKKNDDVLQFCPRFVVVTIQVNPLPVQNSSKCKVVSWGFSAWLCRSEDRVEIVRRALAEAGVGEGGIDFETFQRVLKRTECQLQVDIPTQD